LHVAGVEGLFVVVAAPSGAPVKELGAFAPWGFFSGLGVPIAAAPGGKRPCA